MCYSLYLSTDSSEDLTRYNSELIKFKRLDAAENAGLTFEASTEMVRRLEIGVQLHLSASAVGGVGLW